jgi:hypothetical protein
LVRGSRLRPRAKGQGLEASALRLLGEIASHPNGSDAATVDAHYGAALALANELGMRPLVAHCHLGPGKLYRGAGKREQVREHLTTANHVPRDGHAVLSGAGGSGDRSVTAKLDGRVMLTLKSPWADGMRHLLFEPAGQDVGWEQWTR